VTAPFHCLSNLWRVPCWCVVVLLLVTPRSLSAVEEPRTYTWEESAQQVLGDVQRVYEKARETGEKASESVYEWMREDLQKIGDWEYKVLSIPDLEDASVEAKLNELGRERWECVWVSEREETVRLFFKRPVRSYLSRMQVEQLLHLVPQGGEGDSPER